MKKFLALLFLFFVSFNIFAENESFIQLLSKLQEKQTKILLTTNENNYNTTKTYDGYIVDVKMDYIVFKTKYLNRNIIITIHNIVTIAEN